MKRLFKSGRIDGATQLKSGTILVEEPNKISCMVKCLKTGRSFTINIDVDLLAYGLDDNDKAEIQNSVVQVGKKIANKIGYTLGENDEQV